MRLDPSEIPNIRIRWKMSYRLIADYNSACLKSTYKAGELTCVDYLSFTVQLPRYTFMLPFLYELGNHQFTCTLI